MELILPLAVVVLFVWGCYALAGRKNRNQVGWAFGGLFFGIFALLLLALLGDLEQ